MPEVKSPSSLCKIQKTFKLLLMKSLGNIHIRNTIIGILGIGSFLYTDSMEAQILKKLKSAAKNVAKEAAAEVVNEIECAVFDKECIENANKAGKKVILTNEGQTNPQVNEHGQVQDTETKDSFIPVAEAVNKFDGKIEKTVCGEHDRSSRYLGYNEDLSLVLAGGYEGSRHVMLVNGVAGPTFDLINFKEARVTPDGQSYAYLAQRGSTCYVVLNGKEIDQAECSNPSFSDLTFNNDGSIFYYLRRLPNRQVQVILNGEEGPVLPGITRFIHNPGSKNLFYTTGDKYSQNLYMNNRKLTSDNLQYVVVTDDGQTYAYVLHNGKLGNERKQKLVMNGKEGPWQNEISMRMDAQSGAIYYETDTEKKIIWKDQTISLTGEESAAYENFFTASPDGKRVAYVARSNTMERVYDNGKPGPLFTLIQNVFITENGENLIYVARKVASNFVVINGEEYGPFSTGINFVQMGQKGGNFMFTANDSGKQITYYNGQPIEIDRNEKIIISPNLNRITVGKDQIEINGTPKRTSLGGFMGEDNRSQAAKFNSEEDRYAYVIRAGSGPTAKSWLVLDDKYYAGSSTDSRFGFPVFSPDGKIFAHLEFIQERPVPLWKFYINMEPGPVIGNLVDKMDQVIRFVDNKTLRVLALEDNKVMKYEINL